jgi:hypothetical protein
LVDAVIVVALLLNALAFFLVQNNLLDNVQALVGNLVASAIVAAVAIYSKRK